jgi:Fe-S-cluster containining protein
MKDALTLYKELLNTIDTHFEKVLQLQKDDIHCSKGCTSCCISELTVCSIEAHYMKMAVPHKTLNASNANESSCIFLTDSECSIYEYRPIVCRTQGLPLLYEGEKDNQEKELSVCEKNFHANIISGTILDMEKINTALIMINKIFETEQKQSINSLGQRFTFKEIFDEIIK